MSLSPQCGASQHGSCPGYYKTAHPCDCSCHRPAGSAVAVSTARTNLVTYDDQTRKEILSLLGITGTAANISLLFKLAEHYQLDVLSKEIALIPNKGPFIGVWGRLRIGQRSGDLDGFEADDEWEDDKYYKVRCVVWRRSMTHPAAKVVGRVAKTEGHTDRQTGEFTPKDWPYEIARARAVRAAFGYAFNIHDSFDSVGGDDWAPPPDERYDGTSIIQADEPAWEGGEQGESSAAPHRKPSPFEPDQTTGGTDRGALGEVQTGTERNPEVTAGTGPDPQPAPAAVTSDTEPATITVGGYSLAQRIVIAARDAGIIEDQDRYDVIYAATGGRAGRGLEVGEEDAPRVFEVFAAIKDGTCELRYDGGGKPRLVKAKLAPRTR